MAQARRWDSETISYIEDTGPARRRRPDEVAALHASARETQQTALRDRFVNTNVGHLDVASGFTGLLRPTGAEHKLGRPACT